MAWRGNGVLIWIGVFVVTNWLCCCMELTRIKTTNSSSVGKNRLKGNSTLTQEVKGDITDVMTHGRLLIGRSFQQGALRKEIKTSNTSLNADADYQSDKGWEEPAHLKGDAHSTARLDNAVDRLLQMEPEVECTGKSMKLKALNVESTSGSRVFVDRGSQLSPLPLSKLPPSCGYTMSSTQRDLVLIAPYDGCFVSVEEDCFVLPLRWCGLPVKMSCPAIRQPSSNPSMVTCHSEGMVVKMEWVVSVDKIKVNLKGHWEPLMMVSLKCGFSVVAHPEGVIISARYAPCVEMKDGMFTLELDGHGEIKVSCPSKLPFNSNPDQSTAKIPNQQINETPGSWTYPLHPWIPHTVSSHQKPKIPTTTETPQVTVHPQFTKMPNQPPTQRPKDNDQPPHKLQKPSFPFFPYPFDYHPMKPAIASLPIPALLPPSPDVTKVPDSQQFQQITPAQSTPLPEGQIKQPFNGFPFYLWPAQIDNLPPASQYLNGQVENPFYLYPYYPQQPKQENPTQKPATEKVQEQFYLPPKPEAPQKPVQPPTTEFEHPEHWPYYQIPFFPQPPTGENPQGQVNQPVYPFPFYPPSGPESSTQKLVQPTHHPPYQPPEGQEQKPLSPLDPKPPNPDTSTVKVPLVPGGQKQQIPFYPQSSKQEASATPTQKPALYQTPAVIPPVVHTPGGQSQHQFFPFPYYPQPPKPGVTEAPPGQVQEPIHPQYPEPKPTTHEQPSAGQHPPAPGGYGQHPFFPFLYYPQPPKPAATEAPPGQLQEPIHPQYPETKLPTPEPPSAGQRPPASGGHGQHPFLQFLYYPQPPKPAVTETPPGQVQEPIYPQYPESKPSTPKELPPGEPSPAPGVHGQHPFFPFLYYPQPPKPAVTETPPGQVQEPIHPQYPEPKLPTPEPPSAGQRPPAPGGHGQHPFFQFPYYPQPPKPAVTETPPGQVQEPIYPQYPESKPSTPKELPPGEPSPAPGVHGQHPFFQFPYYPQPPKIAVTEALPGQVQEPIHPQYPESKPPTPEQPSPDQRPPAPGGHGQHPFFPFLYYPQPPKPAVTETPPGQVQEPIHPQYPEPKLPTPEQPSVGQRPPAPGGHGQHPFFQFPYYPQPPKPAVTETPPGQVQEPIHPQYPESKPSTPKELPPGEPSPAPGVHGQHPFFQFPYYPQPPKIAVTEALPGQVQEPIHPQYPESKPPTPEQPSPDQHPPAPGGHDQHPFFQFPYYPQPPKIAVTETPPGQVQEPIHPQYPESKLPTPEQPSPGQHPLAPGGHGQHPFFQFPYYLQPAKPVVTQGPPAQVQEPVHPQQPESKPPTPEQRSPDQPPQAPGGHDQHPFFPFPYYPQPPKPAVTEGPPVPVQEPVHPQYPESKPPTPDQHPPVGHGQHPFFLVPYYPQPPNPAVTEGPPGQVQEPVHPQYHEQPKPSLGQLSPAPVGQYQNPIFQFYYNPGPSNVQVSQPSYPQKPYPLIPPQNPQPVIIFPRPALQKPQHIVPVKQNPQGYINLQHGNFGLVSQVPQALMPFNQPVICPQVCPSGFLNCCPPSVTFHQHHHHIVPPGHKAENVLSTYPEGQVPAALGYSVFGNAEQSAPYPSQSSEQLIEASKHAGTERVNSALDGSQELAYWSQLASQWIPFGSQPGTQQYLHASDTNIVAPVSYPNKPTDSGLPMQPHFVPYTSHLKWPYEPQVDHVPGLQHSQLPAPSNATAKVNNSVGDTVKPIMQQYQLYNMYSPNQPHRPFFGEENPSEPEPPIKPNFMFHVPPNLQQLHTSKRQKKLTVKEMQPPAKEYSKSEQPKLIQDQSDSFDPVSPYYMLQDSWVPPDKLLASELNNSSKPQSPGSDSQMDTQSEPPLNFQQSTYILLQKGPPGSEPKRPLESQPPSRNLMHETSELLASQPQNLNRPQQKKPNQPGREMNVFLPIIRDYTQSVMDGESPADLPLYYSGHNSHQVTSLSPISSVDMSKESFKPELLDSFKDDWMPIGPLGSIQRIPTDDSGPSSVRQDSAASHSTNGYMSTQPEKRS